jgi:hypothetical protein
MLILNKLISKTFGWNRNQKLVGGISYQVQEPAVLLSGHLCHECHSEAGNDKFLEQCRMLTLFLKQLQR